MAAADVTPSERIVVTALWLVIGLSGLALAALVALVSGVADVGSDLAAVLLIASWVLIPLVLALGAALLVFAIVVLALDRSEHGT